jgi:4-hydroxy-2-oxoheptanedioate aldolase
MTYRKNRIIEKLKADQLVTSLKVNCTDSIPVEIACMCGVDCIWLDMEHCAADYNEIGKQILAAKAHGAEVIVRTPRGAYSNVTRPLELDASGVMVPHVMGLEDAKQVVYYTKFHPIGRRPIDGGNADGKYGLLSVEDYIRYSNEEKLTIIQIEDIEALEQVEEIAKLDGIDMLFFGPADFSQSIGEPTNIGNERTLAAKRKVAEVARANGKFAGTVGDPSNVKQLYDMGYRFINLGADVDGLCMYFADVMEKTKQAGF